MAAWIVGVDTGGTFTDLIAVEQKTREFRFAKVPSVPSDPSLAVNNALQSLFDSGVRPTEIGFFVHGTTVATNAILEGKGVRAGLLITRGFRAVYESRGWSQPRGSDLIDTFYQKPPLLTPQFLTEEVTERLDSKGDVLVALDEKALRTSVRRLKKEGVEAIAVCFLFSFLNAEHERIAARIIEEEAPDVRVSLSSNVLPVIREYPRLSTTVIDAYVGPKIERYLLRLERHLIESGIKTPQIFLMQSNGGLMRISIAARYPNQTLLSGPAAGVIAGVELGRVEGRPNLATFDMGGTSTDISIVVNGRILETTRGVIAGQDIGTSMLSVRTLGAGGGTIAWIGKDGLLKVGPYSSGAMPGPACYGRGGEDPTVTDANLVLGALSGGTPLAGTLRLDESAARRAIEMKIAKPLGLDLLRAATGIIRIVNTQMAVDLRLALQEIGQDPRKFSLVAFGGAGPLHASYLARAVGLPSVLVPLYPGINCAMGMLQTSVRHSYVQSEFGTLSAFSVARMNEIFESLKGQALAEAAEEGFSPDAVKLTALIDLRYPLQGYTLAVTCDAPLKGESSKAQLKQAFDELHHEVYGQSAPGEDADIVTFRLQSEIDVPRLALADLPSISGGGNPERALTGKRPVFDVDLDKHMTAKTYNRGKLHAGDRILGPAVIDQFDTTTLVLDGQVVTVDRYGILVIENVERK